MPEMHLRQPRFTYSACGPFCKNKETVQKLKETSYSRYIYQNELGKACLKYDMAYGDFKELPRKTSSDKVLRDKAFNIATIPKCDGCQTGLASMIYNFFDKTCSLIKGAFCAIKSDIMSNQQLALKLHKPIIT